MLFHLEHVDRETIGANLAIPVGPKAIHLIVLDTSNGQSALVSESVSTRRKVGFYPSVSASKNSVPDSDVRDRFDDWVGGWQFGPLQPHHPVAPNRVISSQVLIGRLCRHFRHRFRPILVSAGVSCL
jgi:hypothetical protein